MVDILLGWAHSRDWATALNSVVPTRKRTAGEAAEAGAEPAAEKPSESASEPPKAGSDSAAGASEPANTTVTASADAVGRETALANDEPAQTVSQPSSSAGVAALALQERANGLEGRGKNDITGSHRTGESVVSAAQTPGQAAAGAEAEQGSQPPLQVPALAKAAAAHGEAPHSTTDDMNGGDGQAHAVKKQKTAP